MIRTGSKNSSLISTSVRDQRRRKKKKKKKRIDRRRVASKLTRAVKLGASGDVVYAAVDGDQYPAVRTFAIVLGQFLDREVASQLGQLLHLKHGLLGLRAALDDLVDEDGDHAHQGEIYRALDDLADKARQKLRLLFLSGRSSRRAALLGHLDESDLSKRARRGRRRRREVTRTRSRAPIEWCPRLLAITIYVYVNAYYANAFADDASRYDTETIATIATPDRRGVAD